jgi:DNA mismatch repair ATPase MutL
MSIQTKVRALNEINKEISRLSKSLSKLRKEAKDINNDIASYLVTRDEIGFKCEGNALMLDRKVKHITKNKKSKEESYLQIIQQYGIENPKEFLDAFFNAGKDEKEITKIKIQKLK